ncbi:MAG TPA: PP2C family protein-serine/threonine phosphatase [Terriglobales bacterium]|nr:PP2C family protein-serine/threonine phosphatase [Terriglobales bacterium]
MKLKFQSNVPAPVYRQPISTVLPKLETAELAANYRGARIGGDFYDFVHLGSTKLIFVMLDIAGKRETALHSAAIAQETFRQRGAELFGAPHAEDSASTTKLLLEMNRAIIGAAAGGVCHAPAFLGCYDEETGILTYINAGHTPGVMKDDHGTLLLEANGLPLGLFSHATHDAQFCALGDHASLALVSKGFVEVRNGREEFGIEGVRRIMEKTSYSSAAELCRLLHESALAHEKRPGFFGPTLGFAGLGSQEPNDITAVTLMRKSAKMAAAL